MKHVYIDILLQNRIELLDEKTSATCQERVRMFFRVLFKR